MSVTTAAAGKGSVDGSAQEVERSSAVPARVNAALIDTPGDDSTAHLQRASSQLAAGNISAALVAASQACHRGPNQPQAHYLYGQAWLALNEDAKAERAFAEAIRLSPCMADAWINYGVARYRRGAIEDAKTAMRQVLTFAPNNKAAISNLATFQRLSREAEAEKARTIVGDELAATPQSASQDPASLNLRLWRPDAPAVTLGFAVEFLMKQPVFAKLPFGDWSQVLIGQINRGHFCFVVDAQQRAQGFLGCALTDEPSAEAWIEGHASLSDEDCREGDCVIINAWAAASSDAHRLLIDEGLTLFGRKLRIYARRYNTRGQPRPLRIGGNEPAEKFAAIMRAVSKDQHETTRRREES
jgi:Flp pilus assembly protein TadD/hemolysin-activating ACP:hemolysin acyltransferase